jgi:hypothetical protein
MIGKRKALTVCRLNFTTQRVRLTPRSSRRATRAANNRYLLSIALGIESPSAMTGGG